MLGELPLKLILYGHPFVYLAKLSVDIAAAGIVRGSVVPFSRMPSYENPHGIEMLQQLRLAVLHEISF